MSLISINGSNPFAGQSDPYLSMDSSIDYSENPNGQIQNTYTLQGLLTGCDKNTLNRLRDDLVRSFDWKEDPTIPENITIDGVLSASSSQQIIPTSLDFENSNYVGALSYTIKLEIFTGFAQDPAEDESLLDRTHTVTTTVNEKNCVSVTTNISCTPNQNLQECDAIDKANNWIQQQIKIPKIGDFSVNTNYPLQNESVTVNPITSEFSYTSTHGHECDGPPEEQKDDVPGESGLQMAQCIETNTEYPECANPITVSNYQGEIYKPGANQNELIGLFRNRVLSLHPSVKNLNAQYSATEDNITYSFETKEQDGEPAYEPVDQIINDYTVSIDEDHDSGTKSISINGTYRLINPKDKEKDEVLDKGEEEVKSTAQSNAEAGDLILKSESVTRNPQEGTLSYSYNWSNENPHEDGLHGEKGVGSYSISVNPPIQQYQVVPVLNCEDFILDQGYASQGSISISVTAQGSGVSDSISNIINNLKAPYDSSMIITQDSTNVGSNTTTRNISAIYTGQSVTDNGNTITQL